MERKNLPKTSKLPLTKILLTLGLALIVLGIFTSYRYQSASIKKSANSAYQVKPQYPISIEIPSINTSLVVTQGGIVDGKWILSDKEALYLPTSGGLGEGFNTIIYAHNTINLFGSLAYTNIGDVIVLKNKSGKVFRYKIVSKKDINPKDLNELQTSTKNSLTIFTCDGLADTSRLLVRAVAI